MKFSSITLLALQAISIASVGFVLADDGDDESFWKAFVDNVDSFPTPPPSPPPTPPPSPGPTPPPTPPPTGECKIEAGLNCTAIMNTQEVNCEDIPQEDKQVCNCPDCVTEVQFQYTGLACSPSFSSSGKCVDEGPNPFIAGYSITDCEDSSVVVGTGQVEQGEFVTLTTSDCMPKCLSATISVPSGAATQTFDIDSECSGGNGLVLKSDYGAFESLGYSCSETDTHNCIQKVTYGVKVCNTGQTDENIYDWFMTIDKEEINLLNGVPGGKVELSSGECAYDMIMTDVDRCDKFETCVKVTASATNPKTGLPPNCPGEDDMCFGWDKSPTPLPTPNPSPNPTSPPTPGPTPPPTPKPTPAPTPLPSPGPTPPPTPPPTPGPTLPPSPAPSPFPSPAPSPAPTSSCVIDVNLTQCPEYTTGLDNDCQGRPWTLTMRYNGGNCAQSDNLQPRQKFTCTDVGGGPPTGGGMSSYITATPRGGSDNYFSGNVLTGDRYTLNANKVYDKLAADMTITIYDEEGGSVLQVVDLHLSCSQPLFLFDKFGANQVTQWQETSGRIVSANQTDVETGTIEVKLDTSVDQKPVRLLEMTVLTNVQDQPIDYTSQVAGMVLGPGDVIELPGFEIDIDLGERTRYTFFTTIIGETLDGTNTCNGFSFLECTIGFNLLPTFPTMVPTPSPTTTPFPTRDASSTACEIDADITCDVVSLDGVECDQILAPKSESCPANGELLVAYLRYDGSLGNDVFVEIVCGEETSYIDRMVKSGETIDFRTRANPCPAVDVIISDTDPDLGGTTLAQENVLTSCPGPWTLGNIIAQALVLDAYVDTIDNGATFEVSVLEAEVEFNFIAQNAGQFPLKVTSGTISDTIESSDSGTGGASLLGGLPVTLAPRSTTTLDIVREKVNLSGREGDIITISLSLAAEADNEFALPCTSEESVTFAL